MRDSLAKIISSMISNIGGAQVTTLGNFNNKDLMCEIANSTCDGLEVLKETWPYLTQIEKEEIAAVILSLKKTYQYSEETKRK